MVIVIKVEKCKSKRSISKRSHAWILPPFWRYLQIEDVFKRASPIVANGGAIYVSSISKAKSRKVFHHEEVKIFIV